MKDSRQLQNRIERLVILLFTGTTQQAFWFWLVGLGFVIPTITYIAATLIGFCIIVVMDLIGISSTSHEKQIALGIGAICAAVSVFGYYKLWLSYRHKKGKKVGTT
jgi:hypothetical protein